MISLALRRTSRGSTVPTDIVIVKSPFSSHVHIVAVSLLFLSQQEAHFCVAFVAISRRYQVQSTSVTLVIAVDEDYHADSLSNIPERPQVNCEFLRLARHGNI